MKKIFVEEALVDVTLVAKIVVPVAFKKLRYVVEPLVVEALVRKRVVPVAFVKFKEVMVDVERVGLNPRVTDPVELYALMFSPAEMVVVVL